MPTMKEAADTFLANKRYAVTGVSRRPKGRGPTPSTSGYTTAKIFTVNPNADEVEGGRSSHDLRSIPGELDHGTGCARLRPTTGGHDLRVTNDSASSTCGCTGPRRRQRERLGHELRPGPRHHRHRQVGPADVRADRRLRSQGHAGDLPESCPEDGLTADGRHAGAGAKVQEEVMGYVEVIARPRCVRADSTGSRPKRPRSSA